MHGKIRGCAVLSRGLVVDQRLRRLTLRIDQREPMATSQAEGVQLSGLSRNSRAMITSSVLNGSCCLGLVLSVSWTKCRPTQRWSSDKGKLTGGMNRTIGRSIGFHRWVRLFDARHRLRPIGIVQANDLVSLNCDMRRGPRPIVAGSEYHPIGCRSSSETERFRDIVDQVPFR